MSKNTIPWVAPSERGPNTNENGTPMVRKRGVQEYVSLKAFARARGLPDPEYCGKR